MKKRVGIVCLLLCSIFLLNISTGDNIDTNEAILVDGITFNEKMKLLANGYNMHYTSYDTRIASFKKGNNMPGGSTIVEIVSLEGSEPVYIWYESNVIYYYSEAKVIYMNNDSSHMFYEMRDLRDISALGDFDTSKVETIKNMFVFCDDLTDISPLINWDTSNIKDMNGIFTNCRSLRDISLLTNWNTTNVTDMRNMFWTTPISDVSPLANWDISKVENISNFFRGCSNLRDISPLVNWNTSNVINMKSMFYGTNINNGEYIKQWDISKVLNFDTMFYRSRLAGSEFSFNMRPGFVNSQGTYIPFPKIVFDTDGGNEMDYISQKPGTQIDAQLDPTKEGYSFVGRDVDIPLIMPAEDMIIMALWKINQFTISFIDEDGSELVSITDDYGTGIKAPANPTKNGYEFVAWDREIPEKMPAENLTITAQWKKKSGGWSGGGGRRISENDTEKDREGEHGSADDGTGDVIQSPDVGINSSDESSKDGTGNQLDFPDKSSEGQNNSQKLSGDSQELFSMHKRAYENGLTIYKPGEDAKFDKPLTRQQMAKISSIFGAKFLNQKADDSEGKVYECSQYADLHKSKGEMRGYVVQSCLLGNMGYAYDGVNLIKKFKPYDKLSVAQASVILSRMTWGDKYILDSKQRYQGHMYAVYDHELIDDISDPSRVITRGEAFTMMYRLSQLMEGEK